MLCRICLDDTITDNIVSPCNCTGSQKYVHKNCLDTWRLASNKRTTCTTCKVDYIITHQTLPLQFKIANMCVYLCQIILLLLACILMVGTLFTISLLLFWVLKSCEQNCRGPQVPVLSTNWKLVLFILVIVIFGLFRASLVLLDKLFVRLSLWEHIV